jgi:hypothetical protein
MEKVTKLIVKYPEGFEPDFVNPESYADYRFLIGKTGVNPLVAICMNPSAAADNTSDRTVNRVISASQKLGYSGWTVINTYPERATDSKNMDEVNFDLLNKNIEVARQYLTENNIKQVWGAWGDLKNVSLLAGRNALLELFNELGIEVIHFANLSKAGNPKHPLYLKIIPENKVVLDKSKFNFSKISINTERKELMKALNNGAILIK